MFKEKVQIYAKLAKFYFSIRSYNAHDVEALADDRAPLVQHLQKSIKVEKKPTRAAVIDNLTQLAQFCIFTETFFIFDSPIACIFS